MTEPSREGIEAALDALNALPPTMLTAETALAAENAVTAALSIERKRWEEEATLCGAAYAFESALQRFAATPEGYCPNRGEADESCGCIVCRTQTLITEWEDHPAFSEQPEPLDDGAATAKRLSQQARGVPENRPGGPVIEGRGDTRRFAQSSQPKPLPSPDDVRGLLKDREPTDSDRLSDLRTKLHKEIERLEAEARSESNRCTALPIATQLEQFASCLRQILDGGE